MVDPTPVSGAALAARLRAAGCVFAEDEAEILIAEASAPAQLERMANRRIAGVPLEQVVGWAEFCGLRIAVEPGVFIPRHRTELVVKQAAARARPGDVVADLCCGTGAAGAAIAAAAGPLELHAVDIDPNAVRCARSNLARFGAHVYEGDLYAPLPDWLEGQIDLVVANAPYVPTTELALMPREARDHEPRVALDGGADGLDVLRRVIAEAPRWLAPSGRLVFETSEDQAIQSIGAVRRAGLLPEIVNSAALEATVVIACREPTRPRTISS